MIRTALLFDNFGPYHCARANAASSYLDLHCVEVAEASIEYAWLTCKSRDRLNIESLMTNNESSEAQRSKATWKKDLQSRISDLLSRIKPQAIVIAGWADHLAFAGFQWACESKTPIVLMSESQRRDQPRRWLAEHIKKRYVSQASSALVGGRSHRDYMMDLGMGEREIFLGYDVIDNDYFRHRSGELVETTPLKFLASGRFVEKKNFSGLLNAYAKYATVVRRDQKAEPFKLRILGSGTLAAAMNQQIKDLGIEDLVESPGFIQLDSLPSEYHSAACFVHASTVEQWGLVVNEAMASGLPVLVSNSCGCAGELVKNGVNGWAFDPQDENELIKLMLRMSNLTEPERLAMGTASQKIISEWGPERFGIGLKAAVERALEIGPKRAGLSDKILMAALLKR